MNCINVLYDDIMDVHEVVEKTSNVYDDEVMVMDLHNEL